MGSMRYGSALLEANGLQRLDQRLIDMIERFEGHGRYGCCEAFPVGVFGLRNHPSLSRASIPLSGELAR